MDDQDRLYKLDHGSETAKWSADKIRDLEIRLHRISGILYGDLHYDYEEIVHMRNLCNSEKPII